MFPGVSVTLGILQPGPAVPSTDRGAAGGRGLR